LGNVSETGLLIYSIQDLPVGTHLGIRVFFSKGSEFDGFQLRARIVWKGPHREPEWEGYQYGLEFTAISDEDRHQLVNLLNNPRS
jgi:c-di-GMP-binding flagellar brake protein YcgR